MSVVRKASALAGAFLFGELRAHLLHDAAENLRLLLSELGENLAVETETLLRQAIDERAI